MANYPKNFFWCLWSNHGLEEAPVVSRPGPGQLRENKFGRGRAHYGPLQSLKVSPRLAQPTRSPLPSKIRISSVCPPHANHACFTGLIIIQSCPFVRSAFCPNKIDHTGGLTLHPSCPFKSAGLFIKCVSKVHAHMCESRTSYIASVNISASANNFLSIYEVRDSHKCAWTFETHFR